MTLTKTESAIARAWAFVVTGLLLTILALAATMKLIMSMGLVACS